MDNASRFSNRVNDYVKYRPTYPEDAIDFLLSEGINRESRLADIGSGTGILSRLLLYRVKLLYAVEPNDGMREAAETELGKYSSFVSLTGNAEDTGLDDDSVDFITVAQAFHWFDQKKCKIEFRRILKPGGKVFLIWNNRLTNTDFLAGYEQLLYDLGTDYTIVNHRNLTNENFDIFFGGTQHRAEFSNHQLFNLEQLRGRVYSSSYTPRPGHPDFNAFDKMLNELFAKYNDEGFVRFNYCTEIVYGEIQDIS